MLARGRSLRPTPLAAVILLLGVATNLSAADLPNLTPAEHAAQMTKGLEVFKASVGEVLKSQCVKCHGGKKTEGDFDITSREGLLKGGSQGLVVVPGKSGESLLVKMIEHTEEPHMPDKAPKLADAAIASIRQWIDLGAPYGAPLVEKSLVPKGRPVVTAEDRQFWSFQPLKHSPQPAVKNAAWPRGEIDRFVLAKLEEKGLAPNAAVDRRRLIRRASFDLLGMPPTPAEIDAFVADPAPDAYEKLIDRLLESPRYGERWARHWLDLARFAESHGYEQDYDRPTAYHYRDFVIRALNADMPYDKFVKLQIAGDELEPDNPLAMMATGYLAAGTHATQITASQVEKERYDELDDMTGTIGASLLGLTIGCARCHDHKFDPIPTADYYRMLSTFTTTVRSEVELNLSGDEYQKAKQKFDAEHAPLVAALEKFEKEQLPTRFESWLKTNPTPIKLPDWAVLEADSLKSSGGAVFTRQADGSYLASGANAASDIYTFVAHTDLKGITGIRLDAFADPSMTKGGPGRASNGNFDLTDFRLTVAPLDGKTPAIEAKLVNPKADFEQPGLPIAGAIDDNPKSGWAVDPQFGKNHSAIFSLAAPLNTDGGVLLTFTLKFDGNTSHNIGRPRLSITTAATPSLDGDQGAANLATLQKILDKPVDQRTADEKQALVAWYRPLDTEWQKLNQAVAQHAARQPMATVSKALVSTEGLPAIRLHTQGGDFFEKTYILKRGDLAQKQGEATQSFLQVLMRDERGEQAWLVPRPAGARTSFRRASLANWITDVDKGAGALLARVITNRLWQHHFGRGIVASPSDFGAMGERPTHPELLDNLSLELIQAGWRLKPLHKRLMTSATYLENADYSEANAAIDPDNAFCWRRSRTRLEGEAIRDSMLAISGLLDDKMFGPGSLDEAQRRRSIYFTIKRSQLIPIMMLFDAPDSLQSLGSRSSTTIAPQALALMNNPQVQAYARALAKRLMPQAGTSPADAVRAASLLALGHAPSDDELTDAVAFLKSQRESYTSAGKADALELALADYCKTLMSLNEFIYVE